ncbi:hypothetical protein RUND412_008502 [Rhizina undulata]
MAYLGYQHTTSGRPLPQGRSGGIPSFYPGRDDYLMPEVNIVSPSPQRLMPEVPVQIADSLEHLELEADSVRSSGLGPNSNIPKQYPGEYQQSRMYNNSYAPPGSSNEPDHRGSRSSYGSQPLGRVSSYHSSIGDDFRYSTLDEPSYSPFPKLINPGQNIPPTDDEKEAQIEGARLPVLSSNDPEMQLIWAQDALNFVEISLSHLAKISEPPGRPQTPGLEHQLRTDAISVVSFLADQHHPRAEFMRGNWLEFGKFGFRVDKKEAFRCYARSAEKGYARAEYRMGMQYENSNEPMKAIKHYTQGAALGDSASNYRLGMMTLLGQHGQKQDYAKGVHLIHLAAEAADENAPQGAYVYGMLLARELPGIEVPDIFLPLDIKLAKEMIEKAAFLGFARAQLKMGTAYELCQLGCDFNPALSLHYNALAARQGEAEADMAISKWFLCGHEGVFEKNEELAFRYAQRAASSGLGTAEFALGYFYEIGMYVPVDLGEAQRWYAKAAAHGNKDASGRIDGISRSKTLSRKDHESVAISKIKARHGSQRKAFNPLTEKRQSAAAPIVSPIQEALDMPDPSIPSGNFNYPSGPLHPQEPPRQMRFGTPQSVNPNFINTDIPGQTYSPVVQPLRPGTTVPYPTRPSSSGGMAPGIPPHRPNSAVSYGYGHPPRPLPGTPRTNRSSSGGPGMIIPAGTYPTGPAGRQPGGPPGRQPYPGQGFPPGTPPPGGMYPGYDDAVPTIKQPKPPHGKPGPIDVGFEGPRHKPGLPPGGLGPKKQGLPSSPRMATPAQALPPQKPSTPPVNPAQTPKPPPAPISPGPAPSPAPSPAPKHQGPPGKGPKTFEEMGVPQQPKDQECVIM